jgi:hypothetical protein
LISPALGALLVSEDSRHARANPPSITNQGNVTHCSAKILASASKGAAKGTGATDSARGVRPCSAIAIAASATPNSALIGRASGADTTSAVPVMNIGLVIA